MTITSECAHCGRPLYLEIDSALRCRVRDADVRPLVFAPLVDFSRLGDPSIIDAF